MSWVPSDRELREAEATAARAMRAARQLQDSERQQTGSIRKAAAKKTARQRAKRARRKNRG